MTSTPVTDFGTGIAVATSKSATTASGGKAQGSFTRIMNQTTDGQKNALSDRKTGAKSEANATKDLRETSQARQKVKTEKPNKLEKTSDEQQKVSEKLEKAANEVVSKVAEELDVSEEDVRKAMETLGMNVMDLFTKEGMTNLVVELSEDTDAMSMLTDERLYQSVQKLATMASDILSEVKEELDISDEQLTSMINNISSEKIISQENEKAFLTVEAESQVPVQPEMKEELSEKTATMDNTADQESTTKFAVPKEQEAMAPVKKEDTENMFGHQKQSDNTDKENHNIFQDMLAARQDVSTVAATIAKEAAGLQQVQTQTQDIINQIMDYMKIQTSPDTDRIEMQLHPESLGTLNIQISSKDGVITAQFTAQNDVVKEALESQVVQLKTNFEEQGIKVEAVEVTVESHAFERNLDQEGRQHNDQNETRKQKNRSINLEDDLFSEDDFDEEDSLQIQMMAANGNTVDYTA